MTTKRVARMTALSSAEMVRRFNMETPGSFMHLAMKG